MASNPGILTDWPWKPLGNFKYLILAPWAVHSIYSFAVKEEGERDLSYLLVFPFLLTRMLHNQIWISLSRHRTAKGNNRIVDKGIGFDQVDRERNWDDQILFNGAIFYIGQMTIPHASHLPIWRISGVIMTILLHAGPVEFLYYWLHRLLHHHFLYSRYHSHHHSSIVTEPITSVVHPFGEHIAYFMLFAIPLYTTIATGTASIVSFAGYISYIDFMNNMGHCNFELFSITWLFPIFPPLKYLMYTPSFHSLHHTQFRTNYSLFMPIYDYIYNTMDKSTDDLSENSLRREEDAPNVVHLTHLTTPQSIYHLRIGFASLASKPACRSAQTWYFWILWPITCGFAVLAHFLDRTFVLERNTFKNLNLQSWVVPRYTIQFFMERQREVINKMIGESILEADKRGVKVLSLGLLTQGEDLNENGELYVQRNPDLKVKVVDGSSLAAAVVLNTIPEGTTQVLLQGRLSKVAYAIAHGLCQRGIQVVTASRKDYEKLKPRLINYYYNNTTNNNTEHDHLIFSSSYAQKVWLVGDGLTKAEQLKAAKGTFFIPYSQFPPKKVRKDCFYHSTPAMMVPKSLENMDSCENWLARRVMSAWRAAGIVHALEGWRVNECGQAMLEVQEMWEATLKHGFLPLQIIPH